MEQALEVAIVRTLIVVDCFAAVDVKILHFLRQTICDLLNLRLQLNFLDVLVPLNPTHFYIDPPEPRQLAFLKKNHDVCERLKVVPPALLQHFV